MQLRQRAMANNASARPKRGEPASTGLAAAVRAKGLMPSPPRGRIVIHSEVCERIERKRRSIRATLAEGGVPIAAQLGEASSATIRAFLQACESRAPSSASVRSLALALGLPSFAVAAALRNELSELHRFYLGVQVHRLEALAEWLLWTEPRNGT